MGRRWRKLWAALAVCLALAVTVWPVAAWFAREEENARQVEALEAAVASLGEKQLEQHRDLAKWYNYQLEQEAGGLRGIYSRILDFGEGGMALLEVPELNLRRVVYHGVAGEVGHDPASPLPIGGRGNHTVLILREQHPWAQGRAVYLGILGERLVYRVESVQVMPAGWTPERPTEAGQDLLTLVYDRGSTRTLIRCVRSADLTVRELDGPKPETVILAALSPLVLLLPALGRPGECANRERTPRICGVYRKNREKSKLS